MKPYCKALPILFYIARLVKDSRGALTVVVRVVRKGEGWSYEKQFDIALLMKECAE